MEGNTKHSKKKKSFEKSKDHVSRKENGSRHYKKKKEKDHVFDDDYDRKYSSKRLKVSESDYRNNRKDFKRSSYRERDYENNRYYPTTKHEKQNEKEKKKSPEENKVSEKPKIDDLSLKTGGAYIPPAKLRMMCQNITDKSTAAYQRIAWEALKKSIHGLINKVNVSNIHIIVKNLFKENIIRGKGLLCRSLLQAQAASLKFTNIYTAVIAVVNSKFPIIGELLVTRCVIQFRNSYRRNDKNLCLAAVIFIAHLVNQRVAHEVLALEILTLLLENKTNDSVEIAVAFLKECGEKLAKVCPKGLFSVFDTLRKILHENKVEKRIQYMIEVMHQVRKDQFKDYPALIDELDLIEEEDQFTHLILLDEKLETQDILNIFKFDPDYEENENKYKTLCQEILGSESEGDDGEEEGSDDEDDEDNSDEEAADVEQKELIKDETETNLVAFRRTVYLTINSSLDFEECAHKLLKMQMKPGQEMELCHMFLDCCAQQRTYEKFFGLLAQRFCQLNRSYVDCLNQIFIDSYHTIHRLDSNRLRNAAKFFAHLFCSDAIPWTALSVIQLNEEDTTSSGRVFIKILFQELAEYMGLPKLRNRILDPSLQEALQGLFPKDNPRNTRFSINFFTSIGLGGLTDELRDWLKSGAEVKIPVTEAVVEKIAKKTRRRSSSTSSTSSSSSSSTSSTSSSSSSSSSFSSASSSTSSSVLI